MARLRRGGGLLLVLLAFLGLLLSGRAHEAFHSHQEAHQGCQVCLLGGTPPPPPPAPLLPGRTFFGPAPLPSASLAEPPLTYSLPSRAPPRLPAF